MAGYRKSMLRYLAALGILLASGADPVPTLARIPTEALGGAVEAIEDEDLQPRERCQVLWLLARDARSQVRARVALRADVLWRFSASETEALIALLARDEVDAVRHAAVASLQGVMRRATPHERLELVARWAQSPSEHERAALAAALRAPVPLLIADLAIEQLAADQSDLVRELALQAAVARHSEDPDTYTRVVTRMTDDPRVSLRAAARRALERLRVA
ncbi:MAG: hypothetical protein PVI30_07505 [Myxococcales bacterium]|jgi:hypothetical protein